MERFEIAVPEADLEDLRDRLRRTRWPDAVPGTGWDYGTDLDYLRELCLWWAQEYDWRAHEAALNRFDQFVDEVDGQRLHFLHVRSREEGAFPLVITHGWPGSVVELHKVVEPLADPAAHGGDPADAFHVVCPSLPGYAFSGPTTEPGWDVRRVAEAFAELMGRLGYDRYGAQGGDWGSMVSTHLGLVDPEHVAGVHLNMLMAGPPPGADLSDITEAEQAALDDLGRYLRDQAGYAKIQGTRPQTLAYALNDSPAGLAGWIVEKFREWSDCDGDVEAAFTRDELLTNVSVYWFTGTAGSAARLYYETQKSGRYGPAGERLEVPLGVAVFPREIARPSRRWAEAQYDIAHWTEMERGGHFAALEQPEAFVEDVRAFFRTVR